MKAVFYPTLFTLILFIGGCASNGNNVIKTYDLGVEAPKAQLPALRAVTVRSAVPYDSIEMFYRLAWRDGAEIAPFANSRWAAPPGDLMRKQLLRALPATGAS